MYCWHNGKPYLGNESLSYWKQNKLCKCRRRALLEGMNIYIQTHKHNIIYNVFRFTNVNNELLFLFYFIFLHICRYVIICHAYYIRDTRKAWNVGINCTSDSRCLHNIYYLVVRRWDGFDGGTRREGRVQGKSILSGEGKFVERK